jgi:nucleoside-diphosphate-sugar epimerase
VDSKFYLVTGGTGFLGSALTRRLVHDGHKVRVLDNNTRGSAERLLDVADDVEFIQADIRDGAAVQRACQGVDSVCHLAYVNGTEFFYSKPEVVLEIAVSGIMNVLNGCHQAGVKELVLASSSEVYQTPPVIPTDESVPLSVPDPLNPRYSYGGGKIISELLTINYGRAFFERVLIFRPHNVYGPDMGWEHVVPQLILRMHKLSQKPDHPLQLPIQGTGEETRAFVFIDDFIDGLALVLAKGEHLGIYNIGTNEEITVNEVAREVGRYFDREIEIVPGKLQPGSTLRRCPNINKLIELGYVPRWSFRDGLPITARWYVENAYRQPNSARKDI